MSATRPVVRKMKSFIAYITALGWCLLMLAWVMDVREFDLQVPYQYGGDGLFTGAQIKGMLDNGWYLHNAYIGMPGGLDVHDFPLAESVHFLLLKIISLFVHDWAATGNIYFLLTFPLTTLTSFYVFRRFHISYVPAVVGSLLFTFLPYHLLRGIQHLFLAAYYMIPLITLLVLRVYLRRDFLVHPEPATDKLGFDPLSKRSLAAVATCLVVASTGVYYAFFTCYFLLVAALAACLNRKRLYPLGSAAILIGAVCAGGFLNFLPTLTYHLKHGENKSVFARNPADAEGGALKVVQLLLPVTEHRLSPLAEWKDRYNHIMPLVNENDFASLGVVGSIGFIILLGRLLTKGIARRAPSVLDSLSILNAFAVLLATVGGVGSLFAIAVTASIRSYNRMSVFIAFFALSGFTLLFDKLYKRTPRSLKTQLLLPFLGGIVLLGGLLDQVPRIPMTPYDRIKKVYAEDAEYVKRIETVLPEGAMVFQLPYVRFPEGANEDGVVYYDHLRAYLHSHKLRWSFGAMKGRAADLWQRSIVSKPAEELIRSVAIAGFAGIYIDRACVRRANADVEAVLARTVGVPPIESDDKRWGFYNLAAYSENLRKNHTEEQWRTLQEEVLSPLMVTWHDGFGDMEGTSINNWRWCCSKGELSIHNLSRRPRDVTITMSFLTGHAEPAHLWIKSPLFKATLSINDTPARFSQSLRVPPGDSTVTFACDARRVDAPSDPRVLIFRINDFSLEESHP